VEEWTDAIAVAVGKLKLSERRRVVWRLGTAVVDADLGDGLHVVVDVRLAIPYNGEPQDLLEALSHLTWM
jgi:hypothetical protein